MRAADGYLWAYFGVYFLVAFVWRSVLTYRATGVVPIHGAGQDDAHGFVMRAFKLLLGACWAYLLALACSDWADAVFPPLQWAEHGSGRAMGWLLLAVSAVGVVWAQRQMGVSWRIGQDADTPGPMVTQGVFARSRNPIFLCMRLSLLGLALVRPTAFTVLLLGCGEVLLQVQVRLEEAHLLKTYGPAYADYAARVPRWW